MIWLRQSTAVVVSFGPAVLNSDGVTLVTNLVGTGANQTESTTTGIRLSKNGGAFAARHATATASTYDAFGNYLVTLDTTDTGTLGVVRMQYANASAFCPLFMDMMVVPAAVWDTYFASSGGVAFPTSGTLPNSTLTAAQIATGIWQDTTAGDFTTALSVGKSVMNGVALGTGLTINAYTGNTAQTGDNFARLGAPSGASISADIAAAKVDTAAIKVQTDKLAFTVTNQVDANVLDWKSATAPAMTGDAFARLGAPAGASVSADVAAVKVDTAAVKVQTDKMAFTVANVIDANVLRTNGDATSAANVAKTQRAIGRGTVNGSPTTTSIPTSAFTPNGVAADQFKGRIITFDADTTTTSLRGQSTDITASSAAAAPTFTCTALTTAPAIGDTFSVT